MYESGKKTWKNVGLKPFWCYWKFLYRRSKQNRLSKNSSPAYSSLQEFCVRSQGSEVQTHHFQAASERSCNLNIRTQRPQKCLAENWITYKPWAVSCTVWASLDAWWPGENPSTDFRCSSDLQQSWKPDAGTGYHGRGEMCCQHKAFHWLIC